MAAAVRVLELSGNRLSALPAAQLGALSGLRSLRLASNQLPAEGVPWAALAGLPRLSSLLLDRNPCAVRAAEVLGFWEYQVTRYYIGRSPCLP